MTTIYDELLAAAGEEFLPQAEGEPDAHYIRRLVLIVCSCTDEKWETLSKAAQEWNNAQALRVKDHQDPEECPGFNSQLIVIDEASSIPAIVDAVVDAGWPTGPELPKASSKPYDSETKHTATDAVRALVMQHQDWNQSQIAAELEAHGQPVSLGTIATVRSMTLATIAVAKGLGKWVEG